MTMTMAGPKEARPGESVTYTLSYNNLLGMTVDIRFEWTDLAYLSARRLASTGAPAPEQVGASADGRSLDFAWRSDPGSGLLEFTLQVREDVTRDQIGGHAWLTGTCAPILNGESSGVITAIIRQ